MFFVARGRNIQLFEETVDVDAMGSMKTYLSGLCWRESIRANSGLDDEMT